MDERFSDPAKNIRHLGLREGMRVADFGSGSGHYTVAVADLVGDSGRVYAIDIQQDLLKKVKNLSHAERRNNIEVVWGDIEEIGGTKLKDGVLDAVILTNVLFQLTRRDTVFEEAHRVLKPGGKLFVVDWTDSFGGMGPMPEDAVTREAGRKLAEAASFSDVREVEVGKHHWGLLCKKV